MSAPYVSATDNVPRVIEFTNTKNHNNIVFVPGNIKHPKNNDSAGTCFGAERFVAVPVPVPVLAGAADSDAVALALVTVIAITRGEDKVTELVLVAVLDRPLLSSTAAAAAAVAIGAAVAVGVFGCTVTIADGGINGTALVAGASLDRNSVAIAVASSLFNARAIASTTADASLLLSKFVASIADGGGDDDDGDGNGAGDGDRNADLFRIGFATGKSVLIPVGAPGNG
jgi:hypothetical protein